MGCMCHRLGPAVYHECRQNIIDGISTNLERNSMTDSFISEQDETERLIEKLSSSPRGEKVRKKIVETNVVNYNCK